MVFKIILDFCEKQERLEHHLALLSSPMALGLYLPPWNVHLTF